VAEKGFGACHSEPFAGCHSERSEESLSFRAQDKLREESLVTQYYVYILASGSGTLYTGVTNNLERRVLQHKQKSIAGFSKKYGVNRLVFYEATTDVRMAIAREKQINGWLRAKKEALVRTKNPKWEDLSLGWYERDSSPRPGKQDGTQNDKPFL